MASSCSDTAFKPLEKPWHMHNSPLNSSKWHFGHVHCLSPFRVLHINSEGASLQCAALPRRAACRVWTWREVILRAMERLLNPALCTRLQSMGILQSTAQASHVSFSLLWAEYVLTNTEELAPIGSSEETTALMMRALIRQRNLWLSSAVTTWQQNVWAAGAAVRPWCSWYVTSSSQHVHTDESCSGTQVFVNETVSEWVQIPRLSLTVVAA